MSKPIVFMFSGQGSHYYHMGKELYDKNPVFRQKVNEFDAAAEEVFGRSIVAALYDRTKTIGDVFDKTLITSPAIIMIEYALAKLLIANGIQPDFLLGASLGEKTALLLSGAITLPDILQETKISTELFDQKCEEGKMIAVLEALTLYHNTSLLRENSEMAAVNYASHFVISCKNAAVQEIENFMRDHAIACQTLAVSHGFHSSLLDPAKKDYINSLKRHTWHALQIPVISCATAGKVSSVDNDYNWRIFRDRILFQQTIQTLEKLEDYFYIDLGPSGTLSTFTRNNLKPGSASEIFSILTPFGNDVANLDRVLKIDQSIKKGKKVSKIKKKMTAFLFPGQGSQAKGMGGALFDEFEDITKKTDRILGYSVKALCLEDPHKKLNQTQYVQPALYTVNALWYRKMREEYDNCPDFFAGHSLGEYNALNAAGCIDFENGLKLVKKRGELMARVFGGSMAAILGLDEQQVNNILKANDLRTIDIANINTPSQIVISGPQPDIERVLPIFDNAGAKYFPLNVSAAFHSRYMQEVRAEYERYLRGFEFGELTIPLISNVHARPYEQKDISANLADQLYMPVRWSESIRYLLSKGNMHFEEVGHGTVLTNMIKEIRIAATPVAGIYTTS